MLESEREAEALDAFLESPRGRELPTGGLLWILRAIESRAVRRLEADHPLAIWQTDRRLAAPFIGQGRDPLELPPAPVQVAVVFATKHREEVLFHLAMAAERLEEGGILILTAANDLGAGSLEKRVKELFGSCEPFSKHKCRVLYAVKKVESLDPELQKSWLAQGDLRPTGPEGLWSCPGIFSWKRPDDGSRFLLDFIPDRLSGHGADFGAGNGFLAKSLLSRNPGVTAFDLLEVEKKALDAARKNLASGEPSSCPLNYHWTDITQGSGLSGLDFIVMNPPFHAERGSIPVLGQRFIGEALQALRFGGKLFMVANRHLPYEATFSSTRGVLKRRSEASGFKVLEVEKR